MTTTPLTLPAPAALFAPGESGAGLLGGVPFDAASVLGTLRHPSAREMVASAFSQFTREQLNVIHHVVNSRGHVIVRSTAGSGKSRVLKVIAEVLPAGLRSVAVALNVSIAKELAAQLPADVHASTFHSLGAAKVRESCPVEARFVEWKRKHLIDRLLKARGLYRSQEARALLQLVKATMTHIANSPTQILALIDDLDLVFPAEWDVVDLVKAVQRDALDDFLTTGTYDYEDMLYLPLKMGYGYGSVDVALVDEAQDFSRLQHRLLRHLLGQSGRMVLVGDENQGVNGFAGADAGGMSRAAELDGAVSLQLTVTFRCPTAAVELASEFTDDIKAAPGAKEGEILRGSEDELLTWLAPGDLVMARRNAPVISLALRLASHGTPVEVLGHDLPKTLEGHVNRALAYPFGLAEIEDRLSEYGLSRLQEHYEKGVRGKALTRQLREDADLIAAIATIAGEVAWHAEQVGKRGTAAGVMAMVQSLFGRGRRAARRCGCAPSTRPRVWRPRGWRCWRRTRCWAPDARTRSPVTGRWRSSRSRG